MTGPESPLDWTEDGQPRSRLFGDVYFSAEDGLAETRAVFLQGCGLPEAWRGRGRFVVGELGFGTGLNIAALLDLWMRTRAPGAQLHVFSVEAHPIRREEAERALSRWPEIAHAAELILRCWPGQARGVHRIEIAEAGAILDLAIMDVEPALAGWSGKADAWFLDGFSPALNPQMWRDEVLALVGARSAPGARAATFTVAGHVRRGLAAAGFEVVKQPGFGRKRERLEARLPGQAAHSPGSKTVAIIGGGIAGASAARAVRALGARVVVFEKFRLGAGASGNPVALVTPRLDAGGGAPSELFAQAFRRAVQLYQLEWTTGHGVFQLPATPRDAERFARIAASDLFEPGTLEAVQDGLMQHQALVVEPAKALPAWIGAHRICQSRLSGPHSDGWRVLTDGDELRADAVILAAGTETRALAEGLPLQSVRGQVSWTEDFPAETPPPTAWGGYVAPTAKGILFGATHDRDDEGREVRDEDHDRNLKTLSKAFPGLAAGLCGAELRGRASIRAATPDRLPIAGEIAPGLFALTGLGSRGFCFAPLLGEHVAALALGAPSPLLAPLADLVDPERFARRAARRSHS